MLCETRSVNIINMHVAISIVILGIALCPFVAPVRPPQVQNDLPVAEGMPRLDDGIVDELEGLRGLVEDALAFNMDGDGKGEAWNKLKKLVDTFGARFAGTASLEAAIEYMRDLLEVEFNDNERYAIRMEQVNDIVQWTRDTERATLISPLIDIGDGVTLERNIAVLGSGYSESTKNALGQDGVLTADVIVVRNFDELEAQSELGNVAGKIVVYNQPWGDGYGDGSTYRMTGPQRALEHGAVASLTRSLGDLSFYTPHTGSMYFENENEKIPAGCITVEDAEKLQRLQDAGEVLTMELDMKYTRTDGAISYNLVVDVIGREFPNEIVIFGGHSDSWDVGEGALDDGGGIMITWQVLSILKELNFQPRRTLRLVFWTAEEVEGNPGAAQYFDAHNGTDDVVMVMESDAGTFQPLGLEYSGAGLGKAITEYMLSMLAPIGATHLKDGAHGVDIGPWMDEGYSAFSLYNQNDQYFWYHHTDGDTILLQDPTEMDGCAMAWFVGALIASEYSDRTVWYDGEHPGYHPSESSAHIIATNHIAVLTVTMVSMIICQLLSRR